MKKLFALTALLAAVTFAHAQTEEGNLLVGGNISNFRLDFQDESTTFQMTLTPKIAYFVRDNMALGGYGELGIIASEGNDAIVNYGIGALGRYYISDADVVIVRDSRFFLEANAGFHGNNGAANTNGIGIGFGPGWTYFITENIGLEALLKYNLTVGLGNSTTNNNLNLGVGFQIYLPTRRLAERME
ncbi:outer membrane protein with beta-barrel domain [Anseongella ginsenosidimutans]|uniref:Outer membrane protein with beta-barrel domain n=1 Tax=Anseongella ginsenosidimutans TaxID=496056 RepID=A0A4R3KXZ0_9SPHI|nr:outer membrane beta-barrel protein [Anseongella ginsenosidimutans]QEC51193.1 porin family protein [Anseongella ginsenosidimutans]TCS90134.1 outer membrane protein with beta-barrel domain [Anseongella ginsenosidimutans]